MKELTKDLLEEYEENFNKEVNPIVADSVSKNGFFASSENFDTVRRTRHEFSINIKQGNITDQERSGRCWIFASTNFLRYFIIKKLNLKTFELSQNYIAFYDKLEKCNYFLNSIIKTKDEPVDGRLVSFLLGEPINDGGQWDMFLNIIKKYGIVPKDSMPETFNSAHTMGFTEVISRILRGFAVKLRKMNENGDSIEKLEQEKEKMMAKIYNILCSAFGTPPKSFDFEYRDKDDNFRRDTNITPIEFYNKYLKELGLEDYVSIINAPNDNRPYFRKYNVEYVGNVVEGTPITYLNLPIGRVKELAVEQLKNEEPVFFGSDVGQASSTKLGIMSTKLYDMESITAVKDDMDKATRLEYRESMMTHAMLLLGVNLDDEGTPNRWRVENSWGKDAGKEGYFVASTDWFNEYVYQIVVNKKFLNPQELEALKSTDIIKLDPWDPLGTLA